MRNIPRAILKRSLGLQVIGIAVLMAVLGGGVVGLVVTEQARSVVRDDILNHSVATADLAAALAAGYMGDAEAASRELASRPAVQAAVRNGDFDALNVDLERWIVEHPDITVFISDVNGVTRVTGFSNKSSVGQNRADQDWFQGAMATGQPFLGTPGVSPVTNKPRVPYSVPVSDEAGIIRGVLTASIQLDALSNAITSIHVGRNARASLTDLEHGIILAHIDQTRILTPTSGKNRAILRLRTVERGVLEDTSSTGESVLAGFAPVVGVPWGVLIQEPSADAFAPVDEMGQNALRLVAATMALAVALGAVLALRIGRPLQHLRATADAVAGGDLDRRAGLDRQDEAGELGRAFDHMADRLQASIGRVNESEAGIRAVMDGVADAIVTFDESGSIGSCNVAAERLFGYTAAEIVGRSILRLVPDAAPQGTDSPWFVGVRSEDSAASAGRECEGRHRDGTTILLELAISETWQDGRRRVIVVARDIAERKQAEKVLRHQAHHDELTGLPNRTLLHDRVMQAILVAGREKRPLTLLLVDLDRFKEINDTFGHHHGDLLLEQIGPRLRGVLRASDTVARLGGDEFGILLPTTDATGAVAVARQLLQMLEAPFDLDGQPVEIGASIGVATYPTHGGDAATLLRQADVAMYVAKRGERGVVVYAAEQDHHSAERLALGSELRSAIENGELLLHFQPKLDLRDGTLAGVEALVRWQHPLRGFLPPSEFIPLAEQTGLIYPLTRWVLNAALLQQRAWRSADLDIPVAVNLSRRTLQDPQLPEMVGQLLAGHSVPPSALVIEITESSLMADPLRAAENLSQIRALGVQISIDDFGTGYSSLDSLKNLPVDELKIDQSFVQAMSADPSARAIVRAIIDLADALQLRVVAEGVEDSATWDVLAGLGCDVAQGYFLSRPIAAHELEIWIADVGQSWLDKAEQSRVEESLQERVIGRGARLTAEEEFIARKQAEAALHASEERNRLALAAARMGTWDLNPVGDIHTWSPETEALFGLLPGTFDTSLEKFRGAIHPDDWPAVDREWNAALAEHRDFKVSYRTVWQDGSTHWIEDNGRGLYRSDGTLVRMTGTSMDITERKQAEADLHASEERNRLALRAAGMGSWAWNVVQDKHTWSIETELLSGLAPGSFDGTFAAFRHAIHPDDWPAFEFEEAAALAERRDSLTTYRVVWPDGTTHWLESKGRALWAANGTLVSVTGTCQDITERKQAEEALRVSEERNRLALQAASMTTWDWDVVHDNHTWSNETPADGQTHGAYERTIDDFQSTVHPDDWPAVEAEERAAQAERRDSITTFRTFASDGGVRWMESRGRSLYAEDGTLMRVTGTTMDITDRKLTEEALRASEERFRKQYKSFPLPTYSWRQAGDDFVLQDFNDAAEAFTDGRIGEWLGILASDHYANQPGMQEGLRACAFEHKPVRREARFQSTSGTDRHLVLSYVFVPPETVMVHTEDVTDLKHAEQQRTALAQSEKLRALGQMASGIAHDLNQSLMLVARYSELARQAVAQDPPNLPDLEDLLTTTTQAAMDGGETVKRLLLFTRGAPEQNSQLVDLSKVLSDAA